MPFNVSWKSPINSTTSSFVAEVNAAPNISPCFNLVESFQVRHHTIDVYLDAIPIHSFQVSVSSNISSPHQARPVRLHFGSSFSSAQTWIQPQDATFHPSEYDVDAGLFTATHRFVDHSHIPIAISFVIQMSDGAWLKHVNDNDFHTSSPITSTVPASVELPISWPMSPIRAGRILSLYRSNPFWLQPSFLGSLSDVFHETTFLLAEIDSPKPLYAALITCVDHASSIRSTLFSRDGCPAVRLENGILKPLRVSDVANTVIACIACDSDPYYAVHSVVEVMTSTNVNISTRREKIASPRWPQLLSDATLLNSLGYCTWDAYGQGVNAVQVTEAVKCLMKANVPIRYVIIDDGWQSTTAKDNTKNPCNSSPQLSSFEANAKFSNSLRTLSQEIPIDIIAWTTIVGYWGGVCGPTICSGTLNVLNASGVQTHGLLLNATEDGQVWKKQYRIASPSDSNLDGFFQEYFVKSLAEKQHVRGVKIDAQGILTIMKAAEVVYDSAGVGVGGNDKEFGIRLTDMYRRAVSKAADLAFPHSVVVNCMACAPETLLFSGRDLSTANVCWRSSNDHAFHGVKEDISSVLWHVLCNTMNSVFLGEIFPKLDWDMFRIGDRYGHYHLAARILSGGPVYISDVVAINGKCALDKSRLELLRSVATTSGDMLGCADVGRPTLDCLFQDARYNPDGCVLKVHNMNDTSGLLGLFNMKGERGERRDHAISVGIFCAHDVWHLCKVSRATRDNGYVTVVVTHGNEGTGQEKNVQVIVDECGTEEHAVQLMLMEVALVHVYPVMLISELGLSFCVVGKLGVMNCGGVVQWVSWSTSTRPSLTLRVGVKDSGDILVWMCDAAQDWTLARVTCLRSIDITAERRLVNGVSFVAVNVPPQQPRGFEMRYSRNGNMTK